MSGVRIAWRPEWLGGRLMTRRIGRPLDRIAVRGPIAAELGSEEQRRLRTYLLANLIGVLSAVICLPVVGLTVADVPEVWTDAGLLAFAAIVLLYGWAALRRKQAERAVLAILSANWVAALGTTYVTPWLLPVNVLAVLLPIMVMFMFLSRRLLAPTIALAVVASAGVAAVGMLREGATDPPLIWLSDAVVIGFVPVIAVIITIGVRHAYSRLAEHAHQLQVSRARVVAAGDAARRRLERDLHDGAQHRLVAMSVQLSRVGRLLQQDPGRVPDALAELEAELHDTIANLREVTHGLYPPLLAARGLGPALAAAIRRVPLPTTLDVDGVTRYPAELEAAVYFCCLEALQNVVKHADASSAAVTITTMPSLEFAVSDDGVGFSDPQQAAGTGLANMADRIGAVGGRLEISSVPGQGTVVNGTFPEVNSLR